MTRLVALVVALAVVLVACGDDDSDDDDVPEPAASAEPTAAAEPTATAAAAPGFSGDPDSPFCQQAREVDALTLLAGVVPTAEELQAGFAEIEEALEEVSEVVPEEIDDDFVILVDVLVPLGDALEEADWNLLAVDPAVLAELDDPVVRDAADNVLAYLTDVCGVAAG